MFSSLFEVGLCKQEAVNSAKSQQTKRSVNTEANMSHISHGAFLNNRQRTSSIGLHLP